MDINVKKMDYVNIELGPIVKGLLNPKLLIPSYSFENVIELYRKKTAYPSIKNVIFDIDQTLFVHGSSDIYPPFLNTFYRIESEFNLAFLSNPPNSNVSSSTINRYSNIQKKYGVPTIIAKKKKPNADGFLRAMKALNSNPNSTMMVGDRVFTDVLGANLLGITTVLVDPIQPQNDPSILIKIPRYIEAVFLKIFNKNRL